jgi:leucyl aminopeptidase
MLAARLSNDRGHFFVLIDASTATAATPLTLLSPEATRRWLDQAPAPQARWARASGFEGKPGQLVLFADAEGAVAGAVAGVGDAPDLWAFAGLPRALPEGTYALAGDLDAVRAGEIALAWALGAWRYPGHKPEPPRARLVWPAGADRVMVEGIASATALVRDLVTRPANLLGPAELAAAAEALAAEFGADFSVIVGDDLLAANYPLIHAVGRASVRSPRLIDLRWGDPDAPKVTIVGKGVCFDSGGLDLKPSGGMLLMKKDMGGAAHALGTARIIMAAGLKVRLRVLIPAVENVIAGNAFRPLDVYAARNGLTVEIGNTDAEGRLILADALAEASTESPALLVDYATLTGAARVAVGPDLPALFCNDDATAASLADAGRRTADPVWRLPLWQPYAQMLKSRVADLSSTGDAPFAGAVTAALFLERFVGAGIPWIHLDTYA